MATIYSGGSRRSANPTYTPFTPQRATANNGFEEVLRQQFVANSPVSTAAPTLSEAVGRGTLTSSGNGGNISFGGTPAYGGMANDARTIGGMASALGTLSGSPALGQVGGILGMAGAAGTAKTPEQALAAFARPAASMLGVPGGVLGLGQAALEGNTSLAINSVLGLANPALGAINGLASLFGLPSFGEVVSNWGGKSDGPSGYNVGGSGLTGYGVVGRNTGGGGGRDGGYGGGIGQSGGNAAGVGSAQA